MLLLTTLAFGGKKAVSSFEHLPVEEEELLKHRAQALLLLPRVQLVPLLAQEIKRLTTQRRRQLASADPRRLAEVLSKEKPVMIEVVLRALPVELAEAARAALPNHPTIRLQREVRSDVLSIIRWKLEEALQHNAPRVGTFRFTDLLTLQQREILSVCDRMGARVLSRAIAGLPAAEAEQLAAQLPPDQRSLAMKAAEAAKSQPLSEDDAKNVLGMYGVLENPSEGMRSAGAQRLMRACVAQSGDFAQRMVERYTGDLGKLLRRWAKEERKRSVKGDGGRLDIVEQLERLAQKGIIDRPMRLPPPFRPPQAEPPMLRPPPAGVASRGAPSLASGQGEHPAIGQPPPPAYPGPRRESLSTLPRREAQRSGVPVPRTSRGAPSAAPADGSGNHQRIMRDGKPLVREAEATLPPKRKSVGASPAFQAIPRPKTNDGAKSPVVKGRGHGSDDSE